MTPADYSHVPQFKMDNESAGSLLWRTLTGVAVLICASTIMLARAAQNFRLGLHFA